MNKTLKVMTSAALLAGVVAPVAVTTVDAANTKNIVDKVIYVSDDYDASKVSSVNSLTVKADDMAISTTGDTFRLSLPSGVEWLEGNVATTDGFEKGDVIANAGNELTVVSRTDRDLELQVTKVANTANVKNEFKIPLYFKVDGAEGEIKVTVDPRDSVLSGGQYTIAVVGEGKTTSSIASVKTIKDGGEIDVIRVDETSIGALYADGNYAAPNAKQKITLTLPSNFNWDKTTAIPANVIAGGGFAETGVISGLAVTPNENKITIEFNIDKLPSKLGTFYIEKLAIDADKKAEFGELEVDLDGDKVTSGTLVVANYGDFGTDASLKGDVPTLLAGRLTDDKKDVEAVEVTIKEKVAGSWLEGRSVDVEFPSWVKVLGVDVTGQKELVSDSTVAKLFNDEIEGDSNEVSFDLPNTLPATTNKREFKVKFYISTKADVEGDVTVKVSGRAGVEVPETVIAKVVAPVKVETEKVDVRTGIKKQALKDIVITEAVKGALLDDKTVQLKLSDGEFTDEKPTITVKEGNVKIKADSVNVDGGLLTFDIDGDSTRASQIVISGLSLDLDRAVPEGEVSIEVGGDAIVQNSTFGDDYAFAEANINKFGDKTYAQDTDAVKAGDQPEYDLSGKVDAGEFDRDYVAKTVVATVTTPAEGNVSAETVTLTIGQGTMKVGDKEVALDAAPYIEASTGRTYLPLRAIANAIGANSVDWDNASRTATVIKGGLVAQMTIGQNSYVLNGSKIGMDGKAQINSERTFLPIRALGSALGADVQWDAATQTVTIK